MHRTLKSQHGVALVVNGSIFTVSRGRNRVQTLCPVTAIQYYNNFYLNK